MPTKTIAELRAEKAVRPSTTYKATVGQGRQYVAEIQSLTNEHDTLLEERDTVSQQASDRPRAMGETGIPPRVAEIDARVSEIKARLSELLALIAEYEGDVTITATATDGEWAQWRIKHPARADGEPGSVEDRIVSLGWCDSDALIDDLSRYVTAWNGESLEDGDFDALGLMRPDKKQIARMVVGLYETGDGLGELRRGLSAHLTSAAPSPSPAA